jgi:hypothetical protein
MWQKNEKEKAHVSAMRRKEAGWTRFANKIIRIPGLAKVELDDSTNTDLLLETISEALTHILSIFYNLLVKTTLTTNRPLISWQCSLRDCNCKASKGSCSVPFSNFLLPMQTSTSVPLAARYGHFLIPPVS